MSDVHGNPDEMRQFAYHLNKLAMDFRGLRDSTRAKMNHLNQSWRDNENTQFVQQFEQDVKPLEKLIDTAAEPRICPDWWNTTCTLESMGSILP